jgi:transcriptional regulator with XRE-family HTH domain
VATRRLTQEALAYDCGINRTYLSGAERGRVCLYFLFLVAQFALSRRFREIYRRLFCTEE